LTLGQPVINIDMLEDILDVAKVRSTLEGISGGSYIAGDATRLPIESEKFDITDASFLLNWSNNDIREEENISERT